MNNLDPLRVPPVPYFEAIVNAKLEPRRQRLRVLTPFVGDRYAQYAMGSAALGSIAGSAISDESHDDLVHCYNNRTAPLDRLKADIDRHHARVCPAAAAVCQYCGLSSGPDGFDHYLPKSKFPEFSTLAINLIPCCGECNRRKDEHWLDEDGMRQIVNFYYDTLPISRFLNASIEMADEINSVPYARFYLSADCADYGGLMPTITNHYSRLKLLRRYGVAASAEFADIRAELSPVARAGATADAAQLLVRKAAALSTSRSPNYWKVALYFGMSESDTYLDSLTS
jgi:hypothetical protein